MMNKNTILMRLLIALFICLMFTKVEAQSYWQESGIPLTTIRNDDAMYTPNRYFSVALDFTAIKNDLSHAIEAPFTSGKHINIQLPLPNGKMVSFKSYDSPVMESGLAQKYPSIKTYKGISEDGKSITRFGYGPSGMHATISTPEGEVNIDQISKTGGQYYYSYYTADSGEPMDNLMPCGTIHDAQRPVADQVGISARNTEVELHTYRFALACIGRWGSIRGTKEKALADMVVMVNRVNQIYEVEAGFRLILVNDNDKLIQLDPDVDGYSYSLVNGRVPGLTILPQNTGRINLIIGSNNYDIGHVLSTGCSDVGGVAQLSSACNNNKGAGVTCTNANGTSALINVAQNTFAHELGHQFGTPHIFNYCPIYNNETNQWEDTNASLGNDYEPGSGTTIMSYAGSCGLDNNISNIRDPYYNNGSLTRIYNHTRGSNQSCGGTVMTDNIAPEINIPLKDNFYIPAKSYFVLTGEATDENNDNLTYCWEQHDAGNRNCQYGEPEGSCPLFRSISPVDKPYRFFPREQRIISSSSDLSEILPTYSRDLQFAFTVRDNNPDVGIAIWEYVNFKVDDTAGPFKVLTPKLGEEHEIGSEVPITWDVANTDNELVNCQTVDVYLSIDKALHVSDPNLILLAEALPNNGSADVIIPLVTPTNNARILIMGHNNIFFDITDYNFKVLAATNPIPYFSLSKTRDNVCLPGVTSVDISTDGLAGYNGNVRFEIADLPQGITASFSKNNFAVGENAVATFDVSLQLPSGEYGWTILSISDNDDTLSRKYFIDVISTNFDDLVSIGPVEGLKDSPGLPIFTWSKSFNATGYVFEVASNPSFDAGSIIYNYETVDTFFVTPGFLDKSSVFYWRIKALNSCGDGDYSFIRSLGTVNLDCSSYTASDTPMTISSTGEREIISKINVTSSGVVSDLNIGNLNLTHDRFKDLTATLKSPLGTSVKIFTNSCAKKYIMNVAFDDDSPKFFNCENGVSIFRPIDKLSAFNGENPKGLWELTINDNSGGNGGVLKSVSLDVCGSIIASAPVLVTNEALQIQPNNKPRINGSKLLTEDADNTPNELIYTLVYNVEYGELLNSGVAMKVGDVFSQDDLNQARIFYYNTSATDFDSFHFTVEDGNGGWINITRFNIEINENFPSATNDPSLVDEILIYPNPAAGFFNVSISDKARRMDNLQVMDIHGRLITQQKVIEGLQRVSVPTLSDGVYLVKISDGKDSVIKRIIIQN